MNQQDWGRAAKAIEDLVIEIERLTIMSLSYHSNKVFMVQFLRLSRSHDCALEAWKNLASVDRPLQPAPVRIGDFWGVSYAEIAIEIGWSLRQITPSNFDDAFVNGLPDQLREFDLLAKELIVFVRHELLQKSLAAPAVAANSTTREVSSSLVGPVGSSQTDDGTALGVGTVEMMGSSSSSVAAESASEKVPSGLLETVRGNETMRGILLALLARSPQTKEALSVSTFNSNSNGTFAGILTTLQVLQLISNGGSGRGSKGYRLTATGEKVAETLQK